MPPILWVKLRLKKALRSQTADPILLYFDQIALASRFERRHKLSLRWRICKWLARLERNWRCDSPVRRQTSAKRLTVVFFKARILLVTICKEAAHFVALTKNRAKLPTTPSSLKTGSGVERRGHGSLLGRRLNAVRAPIKE